MKAMQALRNRSSFAECYRSAILGVDPVNLVGKIANNAHAGPYGSGKGIEHERRKIT